MKKGVVLGICVGILLLLSSCGETQTPAEAEETEQIEQIEEESDIDFETGIHWSQFWKTEKIEDSDYCVIPDEDAAVKIATAIYKELPIYTYAAQSVFYDEQDEVWIVSFFYPLPESGPMATDQPCHSIALRKNDGKVLAILAE